MYIQILLSISPEPIVLLPLLLTTCPLFCAVLVVEEKQSLLLSLGAVIPALVARIAPVGPDLDLGRMALVTYRTIVFHMPGLLLLIHGD
jgi:hypothetical protein